jgi:hypothetical protein
MADPLPSLTGHFGTAPQAFAATDWRVVAHASETLFFQALQAQDIEQNPSEILFGLSPQNASALYQELMRTAADDDRLWSVRKTLQNLSIEEMAAIMHLESIRGFLATGAHVMAERNQRNAHHNAATFDRGKRQEKLHENIRFLKEQGWNAVRMQECLTNIKIWPTFTPHPTKDKSKDGNNLFRRQTAIAENLEPQKRQQALQELVTEMLRTPLTPRAKDSLAEETQTALDAEELYIGGMLDYLEDLQNALDDVYGTNQVNLLAPSLHIDVAPRDWHAGDADGKDVPATILFTKKLHSTQRAVRMNLALLTSANIPATDRERLTDIVAVFEEFERKIAELCKPDVIELIEGLKSTSGVFQKYKDRFVSVFTDTAYRGQTHALGPDLTKAIMDDLSAIARDIDFDPATRSAAWRAVMRHKQVGMSMAREETRHNSEDYHVIFENLFEYLKKHKTGLLEQYIKSRGGIEKLSPDAYASFFYHFMQHHQDKMADWLLASNPDGRPREILERFRVISQCFNHTRMGAAIIAEAQPISVVQQQVLAEAFGIRHLVHVALNEDRKTIENAAENLAIYSRVFGKRNVEDRVAGTTGNGEDASPEAFFCVMDPLSDSQKQLGLFIKGRQRHTKQDLITLSLSEKFRAAVLNKLGTGLSYARGGMSPLAVPRMFLNILSGMHKFSKKTFSEDEKKLLRQMASFVSITHQGRDAGMRLGARGQVYDMLFGLFEEIEASHLVIDDKIDIRAVSPPATKFSINMQQALEHAEEATRQKYKLMREDQSKKPETLGLIRLNMYAKEAGACVVSKFAGVGARKDARSDSGTGAGAPEKDVTELRAIGSNIAIASTEGFFDGSYSLGLFLKEIYHAYKRGDISREDLRDLWNDPFYMQEKFPNAFTALACADYEHGFDQIEGHGGKRWTAKKLQEIEENEYRDIRHNDNLVFHAVLAHDALEATAYMEALGTTAEEGNGVGFDAGPDRIIQALYAQDDTLNSLNFGVRTRARFPDISDIQRHAAKARLSRAIQHEIERRIRDNAIDPRDSRIKKILHHTACAHRAQGPYNMEILLDSTGFGHRPARQPVLSLLRNNAQTPRSESYSPTARP